ncbi:hypothetical protein [Streptomyces sp. NPDC049915]|uniref:hypothetical protein n=1 Tax=Streptomyces sp. NPDC049915 TaxID=3155510 RepID=UPI00342789C0
MLALLLSACDGGYGSPSGDEQGTHATAGSVPSKVSPQPTALASDSNGHSTHAADDEVCDKLPAAEVEKIVHKPIKATDRMLDVHAPGVVVKRDPSLCTYEIPKEGNLPRFVAIGLIDPPESTTAWNRAYRRNHNQVTREFGSGTQGIDMGSGIYVIHKGDALITFQGIAAGLDDAVLQQLARKAAQVLGPRVA